MTEGSSLPPQHVPIAVPGYQVIRFLGRGGMGAVYEAFHESMKRRVAIKVLEVAEPEAWDTMVRFEREAWIAGKLASPHIVRVFDRGVVDKRPYLIMEFAGGGSLADLIARLKTHPPAGLTERATHFNRVAGLFIGLARGLEVVHREGIVHRDVKPSNLLLTEDGSRMLLSDFGVARDENVTRMTRSGDMLGTVPYMSPEQLQANRSHVDRRSDLWSLGVSLYEAITLRLPFSGRNEEAYFRVMSRALPTRPRSLDSTIPVSLEAIILKCLEHDPRHRYSTASEVAGDLEAFVAHAPVSVRAPGWIGRVSRWAALNRNYSMGAAAGLLALTLAVAAFNTFETRERSHQMVYHQHVARELNEALQRELLSIVTQSTYMAHQVAIQGASTDSILETMRKNTHHDYTPAFVPLDSLNAYSLRIVESRPLVYKTDSTRGVHAAFVGALVRDSGGQPIGCLGLWFQRDLFLGRHLEQAFRERLAQQEVYGGAASLENVAILVSDTTGRVIGSIGPTEATKYAVRVPLESAFEGYSMRLASISGRVAANRTP